MTADDALIVDDLRRDRMSRLAFVVAGPLLVVALGVVVAFFTGTGEPIGLASTAAAAFAITLRPWRTVPALARQYAANHIAAPWRRLPLLRRTFGLRRRREDMY